MSTDTPDHKPRIPGVRYRKTKRTRWVETTFNGETKLREEEYPVWEPVPPVNLDAVYLRAVITVAVLLTLVAVVWSTTAIGRLLGGLVPGNEAIGYLAATAFEVPWITCLVVQWLLRFQPERAKVVNVAGWIGLGIVVTAVVIDGKRLDMLEVGVVGAFVSVVAKGLWWVVLRLFRVDLSDDAAGWLKAKREELSVTRVMLDEQQRMAGHQAYLGHVYGWGAVTAAGAVTGAPQGPQLPAPPMTVPAVSGQAPDVSAAPSGQPSAPVSGQVPTAPAYAPGPVPGKPVQPPQPPTPLVSPPSGQGSGMSASVSGQPSAPNPQLTEPVLPAAPVPPTAPVGAPNGQQTPPPAPPNGGAHPIGASIAGTVRKLINDNPAWAVEKLPEPELKAMTEEVRKVHGDRWGLEETVRRTRARELKRPRKTA
ncbi:hypothetical protein AB0D24_04850 [Streptomyces javensis]|uniref:hypothetical protein n=1 Tax=Streptomyces javensis TaxID=114698 RepID=UPI0033D3B279